MKFTFIFFVFLWLAPIMQAIDNEFHLFNRAQALYEQHEYEQACQMYQSIEHKQVAVLYNLALSYARQEKFGYALLYCYRAMRVAELYELFMIQTLITYIHKQLSVSEQAEIFEQIEIFIKICILSIPVLLVQVLLCILFFLLCFFWVAGKRYHQYIWYSTSILYLTLTLIWYVKLSLLQTPCAIVIKNASPVFAGPESSFYIKDHIQQGKKLKVVQQQGDYYKVKIKGLVGWVDKQVIEFV
jgi:tetratricopeptide (TPR) repeat protein